jgi:thiamine pyrophosphate-dependent acetolactate synthase large subunit-like protein
MVMKPEDALAVLARRRRDCVVITTMTAVGLWPSLSDTPLDFAYMPSAMGHGPSLALGLALACPGRGVIAINGDGSMLMSLGSLVTLAAHPADVYLVVMDNSLYEVTGGQKTAGSGRADFAALARAAGVARVYTFATLPEWERGAAEALSGAGPVVIHLAVEGRFGQKTPRPPRPMAEQIARLRQGLGQQGAKGDCARPRDS